MRYRVTHLLCSFVVIAFISLSDHIPQPCVLTIPCSCCHKNTLSHLVPGVLVLPIIHIAYLPFSVDKVPSSFYLLLTSPFFSSFFISSFLILASLLCPFNLFFIPFSISFCSFPPSFPFFLSHCGESSMFLYFSY